MRNKSFSFINIFGLSFGLACCLMIFNFIRFEYSYNKFLPDHENIYQVMNDSSGNKGLVDYTIAKHLEETQSEVKSATSFLFLESDFEYGGHYFQGKALLTDSSFFDVFQFPFAFGNPYGGFGPGKIILTEKMAQHIFGQSNAIGEKIKSSHTGDEYMVSGIIKNVPANSSLQFDFIRPLKKGVSYSNICSNGICIEPKFVFAHLKPGVDPAQIEHEIVGVSSKEFPFYLSMQPLKDLYLFDKYNVTGLEKGNLQLIRIFIGIAAIILVLAILNYVNLSLSRIMTRYKEIGLKKTTGASWFNLLSQILFESILITSVSFFFAILISELMAPFMESLYGKTIPAGTIFKFPDLLFFLVVPVILGIISGIYPAIVFSIYTPKRILNGLRINYTGKNPFMYYLTVFQFVIAIILISTTFVMLLQIDFVKHKDLGFNDQLLLRTSISGRDMGIRDHLVNSLNDHPDIMGTTISNGVPGSIGRRASNDDSNDQLVAEINIDSNFLKVFDMDLIAGRMLLVGDKDKVVYVNEKAMEALQWDSYEGKAYKGKEVIGIVGDFHTGSLYSDFEPVILIFDQPSTYLLTIRLTGNNLSKTMDFITKQWQLAHPDFPFIYDFYDDYFDDMYKKEERLSKILSTFSMLAIVISCLGIFGMVEFTSFKRTKEIGIRKALGAWTGDIIGLLTRSYIVIFVMAVLIATPVAWKISSMWLQSFAFRVELSWYHFVLAGGAIAIIALFTISYQTLKAARRNPVESLRYE
jgi:putative ABC transport system permease protein